MIHPYVVQGMKDFALLDIFILTSEDLMRLPTVRRLPMRGNRWCICDADSISFVFLQVEMFFFPLQSARSQFFTLMQLWLYVIRCAKSQLLPCSGRFKENIFEPGEIGGKCEFDEVLHKRQGEHKSPLQSWYTSIQLRIVLMSSRFLGLQNWSHSLRLILNRPIKRIVIEYLILRLCL